MSSEGRGRRYRRPLEQLLDREHLWSLFAVIGIVAIAGTQLNARDYDYSEGDIVEADIIAPIGLRVPDPETTQQRRDSASTAVLDVYDFDPFAWRTPVMALNSVFGWGREQIEAERALSTAVQDEAGEPVEAIASPDVPEWGVLTGERREELLDSAASVAGLSLPESFLAGFWDAGFDAETELAAERLLRNHVQHSLVGTTDVTGLGGSQPIIVRNIGDQQERVLDDLSSVNDLSMAKQRLRRQVADRLDLDPELQATLADWMERLLRPNLTYNSAETQARKQTAAETVDPVFYQLKRGRTIAREGDPVTERTLREIGALQEQWVGTGSSTAVGGLLLLAGAAVLSLWRYAAHRKRSGRFHRVRRLYLLLLLVLVASVLMTRLFLFVGEAVAGAFPNPPFDSAEAYRFAVPYAAGALVIVLLSDVGAAWIYAAVQAVVIGAMTGSAPLMIYSLLSAFAAIYGMARFSERTAMLRTGVTVGAMNVVLVVGLALLAQPAPPWTLTSFEMALAAFGGLQVALLALAALPALESAFNTLTDVKLLELSNMNLPLLKQLAVVAPGTYHHSVVIGTLAEKAAESIGANPLFVRVAAYYHDVGKMRQPEYFIENQKDGRNPHEKLSPHMSALVLIRHVKDGVTYAEDAGLPRPLIDVIPQHHGTRMMRYFYERARKQAEQTAETVREEEFRYPGPKPATKEAALIMLADGVEAMSRLISDPTPLALRDMVRKNVRSVLEDGQLDQCDMTLADLARVEQAFLDVLSGMHHQRIEYPEEAPVASEPAASPG